MAERLHMVHPVDLFELSFASIFLISWFMEKFKFLCRINLLYSKSSKNPHCFVNWFLLMRARMLRNHFRRQCGFLPDLELYKFILPLYVQCYLCGSQQLNFENWLFKKLYLYLSAKLMQNSMWIGCCLPGVIAPFRRLD